MRIFEPLEVRRRSVARFFTMAGWQRHLDKSGNVKFQYLWRGDELLYKTPRKDALSWRATDRHANSMLPTPDAVTQFVRASLAAPDAHTHVVYRGIGHPTANDMTVSYKGPLFPEASVDISGDPLDDSDEAFPPASKRGGSQNETAALKRRVDGLEETLEATIARVRGLEETLGGLPGLERFRCTQDTLGAMQKRVRFTEERLGATEAKLEYAIERLGGERAVAVNGQILNADTVPKVFRFEDTTNDKFTPVCFRAIRPTILSIHVKSSSSRLRVVQQDRLRSDLGDMLSKIADTIESLSVNFCGSDASGKCRLNLPSLPKLKFLALYEFGGAIENTDCLVGLKASPCLKHLVVVNTQVVIPALPSQTEIQRK